MYPTEHNARRKPGRPPRFDRTDVVRKAQQLFWAEGLRGVSLDALSATTGLHKPSLYAAFGGKAGLYLTAIDAYLATEGQALVDALGRARLGEALEAFFKAGLRTFCDGRDVRGCFLIGTAPDAAAETPEVMPRLSRALDALRGVVRERFHRAAAEGELDEAAEVELLTDMVMAAHVMIAVEAKIGTPKAVLAARVDRLLGLIETFRPAGGGRRR